MLSHVAADVGSSIAAGVSGTASKNLGFVSY